MWISPAPAPTEDRARVFDAEITAQINLNSSRSDIETHHVELSLAGSGIAYEPGDSLGFVPRNDPALVEDVLRLAGLDGDAALHTALTERFDITTLTRAQIADYAALTGDATLRAIGRRRHARRGIPARPAVRRSAGRRRRTS